MEKEIIDFLTQYWLAILLGYWFIKKVINAVINLVKESIGSYKYDHSVLKAIYDGAQSSWLILIIEIIVGASWILRGMRFDSVYDIFASVCFVLASWVHLVPYCNQIAHKNYMENRIDETDGDANDYIEPDYFVGTLWFIIILIVIVKLVFCS